MKKQSKKTPEKKVFVKSQNRQQFELLSASLKSLVDLGHYENINAALKAHYAKQGHTELHTFLEWAKLGYAVEKFSKALYLWSKPIKTNKDDTDAEKSKKFHASVPLFSNLQVKPIEKPETNN
jgi:hypothetical protein